MSEDEQLRAVARSIGGPGNAEVIATMPLLEYLDRGTAKHPFVSKVIAAAIGGLLFEAGRFHER
jgi:hypothetical protein